MDNYGGLAPKDNNLLQPKKTMKFITIKFILSKFFYTFKNSNNSSKKNLKHDHW